MVLRTAEAGPGQLTFRRQRRCLAAPLPSSGATRVAYRHVIKSISFVYNLIRRFLGPRVRTAVLRKNRLMSSRQGWRRARSQTLGTSLARYRTLVGRAALSRDVPRLERFAHRFMPRRPRLDRSRSFGRSSSHRVCGETVLARASFNYSVFNRRRDQLSGRAVGQERLELSTPRLSSACSNQLSYWPLCTQDCEGMSWAKVSFVGPIRPVLLGGWRRSTRSLKTE
jgi:hypothetical protein